MFRSRPLTSLETATPRLDDWNEPLPREERDKLLDKVAEQVARRGLESPTVWALEMHKPLAFVASQALIVGTPLFGPLLGLERMQTLNRLLSEPGTVEELIARIEARATKNETNGAA